MANVFKLKINSDFFYQNRFFLSKSFEKYGNTFCNLNIQLHSNIEKKLLFYYACNRVANRLRNVKLSGKVAVIEKKVRKFNENQGVVMKFQSYWINIAEISFYTVSLLFLQNTFYHILCLIYFITKHCQILDCMRQWNIF